MNKRALLPPKVDEAIKEFKEQHGTLPWDVLAEQFPEYSAEDLRKHWHHHLGEWTSEEDGRLRDAKNKFYSPWSKVADYVGNRTANACKNRWAKLNKQEMNPISSAPFSYVQDGKEDACVVKRKRKNRGDETLHVQITREDIAKLWLMRRPEAASWLGITETMLHKVCIELDLPRWGKSEGRRNPIEVRHVVENYVPQLAQTPSEEGQKKIVEDLWTAPLLQEPETAEGVAVTSTEKSDEDRPNAFGSESAGFAMLCEEQSKKVEQQVMETSDDKRPGADAGREDFTAMINDTLYRNYCDYHLWGAS